MFQNPLQAPLNLAFADPAAAPDLDQHQFGFGRNTPIQTAGESAVTGGNYRGHHAMPAGDIICLEGSLVTFSSKDAVISENAIVRLGQIGVGIKA